MIVVDTHILAYLYLPGDRTAHAEALLERDPEWAAPVLWRSEFRNILAGFIRRGTLTFDQACGLQGEAESLLDGAEYEVDSNAVLALVRDSNCSAYDCEFIALATKLNTKLVTVDKEAPSGVSDASRRALSGLTAWTGLCRARRPCCNVWFAAFDATPSCSCCWPRCRCSRCSRRTRW